MQTMLSKWKICLNIINWSTYDENLSILSKISEIVKFTTCTNFLIWCQQTTKTISKCSTNSFGPVCKFYFVALKCLRRPQRFVQQHKSLKWHEMQQIETNTSKKHRNKLFPTISSKCHANARKICFLTKRVGSMSSIYKLMTKNCVFWVNLTKQSGKRVVLHSQFDVSKLQKQL